MHVLLQFLFLPQNLLLRIASPGKGQEMKRCGGGGPHPPQGVHLFFPSDSLLHSAKGGQWNPRGRLHPGDCAPAVRARLGAEAVDPSLDGWSGAFWAGTGAGWRVGLRNAGAQARRSLPPRGRDAGARGHGPPYPMCSESLHEVPIGFGVAIGSAGAGAHVAQLPQKASQGARRRPERRHVPVLGARCPTTPSPPAPPPNGTVEPSLLLSSTAQKWKGSLPSAEPHESNAERALRR